MATFRYLLIADDGDISGTNDKSLAQQYVEEADCVVVDTKAGTFGHDDEFDLHDEIEEAPALLGEDQEDEAD